MCQPFPKAARTTKDGVQFVNGVALEKTVFADDPFNPVKHSAVSEIIGAQTELHVKNIKTGAYSEVFPQKPAEKSIYIIDAETGRRLKRDRLHAL